MRILDLWPVIRILAMILHVPGAMALVTAGVADANDETREAIAFLVTGLATIGLAQALYRGMPKGRHPDFRENMAAAALGWLAASVVGAVPFLWIAHAARLAGDAGGTMLVFTSIWNAAFEAVSGFTTTGLTMAERPSELPASLQFWRSLMQWVGGAGVVVLVLAAVHPREEVSKLFRAEGHEPVFGESVLATVRGFWWIYAIYTLAGAVLLYASGMTAWQAANFAMTAISTGGFSVTDGGVGAFGPGPKMAIMLLMLAGAVSFVLHARLFRGNWKSALEDIQLMALLALAALGGAILILRILAGSATLPLLDAVFQWTSALTTSGFASVDAALLSDWTKAFLILAMVIGGSTGSAAGGVKLLRVVTLVRELGAYLGQVIVRPWLLVFRPATLAEEVEGVPPGKLTVAALLLVLWIAIIGTSSLLIGLLAGPRIAFIEIVFDVTSAISIVGLSTSLVEPGLHWTGKALFMLLMWMGRLEILPVLVLIGWLSGARPAEE